MVVRFHKDFAQPRLPDRVVLGVELVKTMERVSILKTVADIFTWQFLEALLCLGGIFRLTLRSDMSTTIYATNMKNMVPRR